MIKGALSWEGALFFAQRKLRSYEKNALRPEKLCLAKLPLRMYNKAVTNS